MTTPHGHTDPKIHDSQYETAQQVSHATKNNLFTQQLKKLQIALKHATKASTKDYLRRAGLWTIISEENLDTVLSSWVCQLAKPPLSHPILSTRPPDNQKQREISIDVIVLEQSPFRHCVDWASSWSKVGCLGSWNVKGQIRIFTHTSLSTPTPFYPKSRRIIH